MAILDEAFAGLAIATATTHAQQNLQNAQDLFQSTLQSTLQSTFEERGANWDGAPFLECVAKIKLTTKIPRKKFLAEGTFPIVSQESEFVNGFWNEEKDIFKVTSPVVIFGDHTQVLKYVDFDFVLGADGVKVIQPLKFLNGKFFYYFLKANPFETLGYARHDRLLKDCEVSWPKSIATQQTIVEKLDALSAETRRLQDLYERKLAALAELKQSLLHQAFSGQL